MATIVDYHSNILSSIKGQQMNVPSMDPIFAPWKQGVNPLVHKLEPFVEDLIVRYVPTSNHLVPARASMFSLFAALWYPDCSLEKLQFGAAYNIWLFFWDDNLDREEASSRPDLANSVELGTQYGSEAKAYVKYHLGFMADGTPEPKYNNPQMEIFKRAAEILRRTADQDTLERFLNEVLYYINSCQQEQEHRLAGKFPSVQDYWSLRLGTSSVYTACAITPWMCDVVLPKALLDSTEMQACWNEINMNIIYENDILSFKKEVDDGAIRSLVPLVMLETGNELNDVVVSLVDELLECSHRFDRAALKLQQKAAGLGASAQIDTETLVRAFKTMQSGCYYWSIVTGRYGVGKYRHKDGSLLIDL